MEKDDGLPRYSVVDQHPPRHWRRRNKLRLIKAVVLACLGYAIWTSRSPRSNIAADGGLLSVEKLESQHKTCAKLRAVPTDPHGHRERNARSVDGQAPILLQNATVWTGEPAAGTSPEDEHAGIGYAWNRMDVLLQHGLITRVEHHIPRADIPSGCQIINALGRPLTAGIVDMHSHAGVMSLPTLEGNTDDNEMSNDITPYVRSIDGFNAFDSHIEVVKSGGVTTSLVLPGSGNNMGGEAFVIKHSVGRANGRPEISTEDMLADPEHTWRYMKMACGENAKGVYGQAGRDFGPFSRMGEAWYFRHAFEEASKLKNAQDDWCDAADKIGARNMPTYLPEDLKWESLSAALRGQVLINTHCYTIPDFEAFVRHTNEFKFSVRAFHHAHQTYLVPETLKKAYGSQPPAAALFADMMNYKAESYIASEQAGKILYESGITPVYVSDGPAAMNAQHVVFEAAKAHKNGLPYHVALAGVTSAPAALLGLGNRIGKVKAGFDADITLWDSDPLSVGATPVQVFIDGIPQFAHPVELKKPQASPIIHTDMASPSLQEHFQEVESIAVTGITRIFNSAWAQTFPSHAPGNIVFRNGSVACIGECVDEMASAGTTLRLRDGHISPPLTAFGSFLGLVEIDSDSNTQDGANDGTSFSTAFDGLAFDGKNLRAAYLHGVTRAISAPKFAEGAHKGVSAGFRVGAPHALAAGAIFAEHVALHYSFTQDAKQGKTPTLSGAIAALRAKLIAAAAANHTIAEEKKEADGSATEEHFLARVVHADFPLVITVHSADVIAAVLRMKTELDAAARADGRSPLRLVLYGAAEAYLVADAIARADVGVVLAPLLSYGLTWDQRRALTGAPLTNGTAIDVLRAAGVRKLAIAANTAVGDWETRDIGLHAAIAYTNGQGHFSADDALALVSANIYEMLGLDQPEANTQRLDEFVVYEGNPLTIQSQVRGVADGRGKVGVWV